MYGSAHAMERPAVAGSCTQGDINIGRGGYVCTYDTCCYKVQNTMELIHIPLSMTYKVQVYVHTYIPTYSIIIYYVRTYFILLLISRFIKKTALT